MNRPIRTLRGWSIRTAAFAHAIGGEGTLVARFGAPAIALAVLAAAVFELHAMDWPMVLAMVPTRPLFWLVFAVAYLVPPACDWLIYRRIWAMPARGLLATVRKMVGNELLFGYVGEAYLYAWARREGRVSAQAFGAVKDVSILSAIAGNAMTLAMVGLALVFGINRLTPDQLQQVLWSVPVILAITIPFLIFSRRVFSLPRRDLWWVFWVHCGRLAAGSLLISLAWHFALPMVGLGTWMFLAAMRMLVSRLPLVPNKDLLFANFAILLIGQDTALSEVVAFTSAITLLIHVVLIIGFGAHGLVKKAR